MIIFFEQFFLLKKAINRLIIALKIFFKKLKSPLKVKRNLRLLRALLGIFWETYLVGISLWNKIFFLDNIRKWRIQWKNLIRLLMQESVFIIGIIYGLYLIFLAILGILLGFLLGVYNRDDEIYVFLLLRLLNIFYNNRFYFNVLFEYLNDLSLESKIVEQFSKLSLKTVEQIQQRPLKIILKKPDTRSQIK